MSTVYPGGSVPFSTFSYTQQVQSGTDLYFNPDGLDGTYKSFKFSKTPEFQLYYLVAPTGKVLPSELSAHWTKISLMQSSIDAWLVDHPTGELQDYVEPPPRRIHRKKEDIVMKEDNNANG